jgi:hypothetical protein
MKPLFPHEKLDVYGVFLQFAQFSGEIMSRIASPAAILDHLERATESIGANLIRGNNQTTAAQKRRYFDVSFASSLECAACLDVLTTKEMVGCDVVLPGKRLLWRIRGMMIGLRRLADRAGEDVADYGDPVFPHESLDVYRLSLDLVGWADVYVKKHRIGSRDARRIDKVSTGIVLNIAEGNGRYANLERVRFLGMAEDHALQMAHSLALLEVQRRSPEGSVHEGRVMLHRIVSMLIAWRGALTEREDAS